MIRSACSPLSEAPSAGLGRRRHPKASGTATEAEFAEAYFREWATWFTQPCIWAKEQRPHQPVGIYGPQPFRRDYWGIAGKDARQIDGTHARDADLWTHIDPAVDFVGASVYIFYDEPGAIYYIASNIEENVARGCRCRSLTAPAPVRRGRPRGREPARR